MPHYFAKIIFWKIFLQKYFFQKCLHIGKYFWNFFSRNIFFKNIFVTIFLVKIFLWKYFLIILGIFFQKYFWRFGENIFVHIFLAKIFLRQYFWWKYFGENIFWSFLYHQGFPFSHQSSTPSFTSFWSEVWRTHGLSVPFIVLDCICY